VKIYRYIIYGLGITSCLIRYFATYYLSIENGSLDRTFFSYTQFHTVLLAIAIFTFIKYLSHDWLIPYSKILRYLSSCSLGIYLTHKFFIDNFSAYFHIPAEDLFWRLGGPVLTYIVCLLVVCLLKQIPYVRRLVP